MLLLKVIWDNFICHFSPSISIMPHLYQTIHISYFLWLKSEGGLVIMYYNCLVLQNGKGVLVKAVGVVDASADTVFEIVLNPDRHRRYE